MSDFVGRLLRGGDLPPVRPRLPALFEPYGLALGEDSSGLGPPVGHGMDEDSAFDPPARAHAGEAGVAWDPRLAVAGPASGPPVTPIPQVPRVPPGEKAGRPWPRPLREAGSGADAPGSPEPAGDHDRRPPAAQPSQAGP